MKKIIKIDGMKCEHCSSHVEEALKAAYPDSEVKVSLFRKQATVSGDGLDDEKLKSAVEGAGYTVIEIK